ncbi:MAG: WXG100 family type VII secretion target [Clostridiales bacterium]|jgi:WXG100 family type VII secretion target|nr:WXG100 family type VII secretion target [Clostridiales bacterium]
MASSYEVRKVAQKIKTVYREIDTRREKVRKDVREVPHWWKGKASEAFVGGYEQINNQIGALLSSMDELERQLKAIAAAIDDWARLQAEQK